MRGVGNGDGEEVTIFDRDLKSLDPTLDPIRVVRERTASRLATLILIILAVAVVGVLTLCFLTFQSSSNPKERTELLETIFVAGEHFIMATIGPLMAFVLGYFFGTSNER